MAETKQEPEVGYKHIIVNGISIAIERFLKILLENTEVWQEPNGNHVLNGLGELWKHNKRIYDKALVLKHGNWISSFGKLVNAGILQPLTTVVEAGYFLYIGEIAEAMAAVAGGAAAIGGQRAAIGDYAAAELFNVAARLAVKVSVKFVFFFH
jgi:hypothetical protein